MRTVQERELFVYKMAASEDESKGVYEGHLYTVEQRLETFKGSHWPYDSGTCTPLKVSFNTVIMYPIIINRWQRLVFITVVHLLLQTG